MTIEQENKEPETQTLDMDAATAELSEELFGQGSEFEGDRDSAGEKGSSSEGSNAPTADAGASPQPDKEEGAASVAPSDASAQGASSSDNSAEVRAIGAPQTWTKEALETWATIPPRAQQEIIKREEDFLRGIQGYKAAAELGQSYDKVVEPYRPILAAENVDPVQLFQSFAANHYLLSRGTDSQKVELAATLINGYKIPLANLLNHIADGGGIQKPEDPTIKALRDEIATLKGDFNSRQESERAALQERAFNEIKEFADAKDEKGNLLHPYFDELADDITKLFQTGAASNPAEAYELAVYRNPIYRQKEIDRLTAERTSASAAEEAARKDKVARSTADQVRTTSKSRDGTVPTGSMDDTMAETLAAIKSRG